MSKAAYRIECALDLQLQRVRILLMGTAGCRYKTGAVSRELMSQTLGRKYRG